MSESDSAKIKELVCTLFRAENPPGNREDAKKILADDNRYLPIIRGSGKPDTNRNDTLKKFEKPNPNFNRHVEKATTEVTLLDDRVAIARTLLPMTDSTDGTPKEVAYRNMHVFQKEGDQWKCVAWQVTKVQDWTPTS